MEKRNHARVLVAAFIAGSMGFSVAFAAAPLSAMQGHEPSPLPIDRAMEINGLAPDAPAEQGHTVRRGISFGAWQYQIDYVAADGAWRIASYSIQRVDLPSALPSDGAPDAMISRIPIGDGLYPGEGAIPEPNEPQDPSAPWTVNGGSCPMVGFPGYKGVWEHKWVPGHDEKDTHGIEHYVEGRWTLASATITALPAPLSCG